MALLKNGLDDILPKSELHLLPSSIFKAIKFNAERSQIKLIKQQRWEESQKYKGLLEHSHDPIIAYKEDGTITYASEDIKNVLGYSKEEFLSNKVEFYVHPEDLILRQQKFKTLLDNTNDYFVLEQERVLHKKGHYIWIEAVVSDARLSPGINGFVTNFRDITTNKLNNLKLEKTLKELTDHREALIESSIVAITDTEGIITYVNDEFCKVSKYSKEELIGKNLINFDGQEEVEELFQNIIHQISNGNIWKGELQKTAKDGNFFWVNGTIIPFIDTNGNIYQYFVVMHNITEKKQKTKELEETLDLVYAQNERLLNFSYIVSHNLRSHASNFNSILEYLTHCDNENEKVEMIHHLQNVSQSLNDVLLNLNEVISIQSNKSITTNNLVLVDYIKQTLINLKDFKQDSETIIDLNIPESITVNFNRGYLESILQNLIQNSIKYKHPYRPLHLKMEAEKNQNLFVSNFTSYIKDVINLEMFFSDITKVSDIGLRAVMQSNGTKSHSAVPIYDRDKNLTGIFAIDWVFSEIPEGYLKKDGMFTQDFKDELDKETDTLEKYLH